MTLDFHYLLNFHQIQSHLVHRSMVFAGQFTSDFGRETVSVSPTTTVYERDTSLASNIPCPTRLDGQTWSMINPKFADV